MRLILLGFTLAAVALDSAPLVAQRAGGAGWAAYYGCWTPGDPSAAAVESRRALVEGTLTDIAPPTVYAQGPMRCVLPGNSDDRVQMLTVQRGRVVDRQEVIADGAEHAVDRDGCTGRERATWTGGGARLVVTGDLTCSGGTTGTTSSMLDVMTPGAWVQVSGIRSGKNVEARPQWYRRVAPDSTWPAEVAGALAKTGTSGQIARVGAIADPDVREVVQLAAVVDEAVLRAWLVSRSAAGRRSVPVDGETLLQLAKAGVSGSVTDVMVALANPESFDLTDGGVRAAATASTGGGDGRMLRSGYAWVNDAGCYGPWSPYAWSGYSPTYGGYFPSSAFDGCNMYGYSPYGRGWSLGLAYGYPYGSPYLGYGGGWFWRPVGSITPVVRGPDTRTTLSKGGGYSPAGSGQGQGRTAGSSGSSGGTTANSTGSGGAKPAPASSSGGRTAVKKP